ncbi:MAG: hypothetical protein J7K72_03355 [Candidatus Aenigmarchaeota archaeon]|nr:hypothetical protein [Candidatus Aenigmarchaeota archaeon]
MRLPSLIFSLYLTGVSALGFGYPIEQPTMYSSSIAEQQKKEKFKMTPRMEKSINEILKQFKKDFEILTIEDTDIDGTDANKENATLTYLKEQNEYRLIVTYGDNGPREIVNFEVSFVKKKGKIEIDRIEINTIPPGLSSAFVEKYIENVLARLPEIMEKQSEQKP